MASSPAFWWPNLCGTLLPCKPVCYRNLTDLQSWEKSRDCATGNSFIDIVPTVPKDRKLMTSMLEVLMKRKPQFSIFETKIDQAISAIKNPNGQSEESCYVIVI